MIINRSQPSTRNIVALSAELAQINGPCVGCTGCKGMCQDLIDAVMLPSIILSKHRESQ